MTKATTRRFFFIGTVLFTLVFIALTVHTHTTIASRTHADRLTAEVRRGGHAWARYNCENCHTLLGEGAYYAPDLTQVVQQRGAAYLAQFLANPAQFYTEARDGRLMPTLGMSPQEITDVIAFLDWVGHIDTNGWPPQAHPGVWCGRPGHAGGCRGTRRRRPYQPRESPVQWPGGLCRLPLRGTGRGAGRSVAV